jgi:hypothetical protein
MGKLFETIVVTFTVLAATGGPPILAQSDVAIPPAEDCRIAPRTWEEINGLQATVTASGSVQVTEDLPAALSAAHQADPVIETEIRNTFWEVIACINKGSAPQLFALYSDRLIRELSLFWNPADVEGVFASPATPQTFEEQTALVALWDVRELEDGRIGAFVAFGSTRASPPTVQTRYVFFVQGDDRWVVDDLMSETELRNMGIDVTIPESAATPVAP